MRVLTILLFILAVGTVSAEETAEITKKPKKEYRKTGTLASSSTARGSSVDAWNDTDPTGKESQPIDGSIFRVSEKIWRLKLFNNSKASVQVSVAVNQFNKSNSRIKRDVFSYTIAPKKEIQRNVTSLSTTTNTNLDLLNWKALGNLEGEDEEKKEDQEKKAETKIQEEVKAPAPPPTVSAPRRYRNIR